jgi:site-specific DNA recombinase
LRRQPSTRNRKTSHVLRPREEWITVEVPSLVPNELFEAVQRKLEKNAELSRRNTKREYLLSGLLYCSQCGGRMGGHTIHNVPYYRCYRKDNPDRIPFDPDGEPQPCSCPEVKAEAVESVVWDMICQLIRDPDFLIQELHKRTADNSQTKEILERESRLCEIRLKAMPDEHSEIAWFPVREAAKLALAHPEYPELFKKIENNLPVLHKSASPSILAEREDI